MTSSLTGSTSLNTHTPTHIPTQTYTIWASCLPVPKVSVQSVSWHFRNVNKKSMHVLMWDKDFLVEFCDEKERQAADWDHKEKVPEFTRKDRPINMRVTPWWPQLLKWNNQTAVDNGRTEDSLWQNERDRGHDHLLGSNFELLASNPDLQLPLSLVHHPVLHLPSWIPVPIYILLFYPTSILCHAISANHTY